MGEVKLKDKEEIDRIFAKFAQRWLDDDVYRERSFKCDQYRRKFPNGKKKRPKKVAGDTSKSPKSGISTNTE